MSTIFFINTTITAAGAGNHRIMCIGDSITESEKRENSWRYMLVQKLCENGYKDKFDMVGRNSGFFNNSDTDWDSEHCGYYSAKADHLLNGGLPRGRDSHGCIKQWAPEYKPTIALIHLGTNDSRGGQSPESTLKDIEGIINHLRLAVPVVKIVVAQIIPIGKSGPEKIAQELNSKIPTWAKTVTTDESPVKVVDMHSNMQIGKDQGTYHPYGQGSKKMADKWYAAIEEWFAPITKVRNGCVVNFRQNHENKQRQHPLSLNKENKMSIFQLNGRNINSTTISSFNLFIVKSRNEPKGYKVLPN